MKIPFIITSFILVTFHLTAQNVGIGTTTPSKPLDVALPGGIQISRTENGSTNNEIFFSDNGQIRSLDDNHRIIFNRSNDQLEFNELGKILFLTGNPLTEAMRINSNGYVGIGTTLPLTPNNLLSVAGGITVDFNNQNNGTVGNILSFGSSGDVGIGSYRQLNSPVNYHGLDFYTNYTKRMSIDAGGNVGIGTTIPAAKLDVEGNVKIVDGTQADGKILTSDVDGNAYWKGVVTCSVAGLSGTNSWSTVEDTLIFTNELYDDGNDYDLINGVFIAPSNGIYHFDAGVSSFTNFSTGYVGLQLKVNGAYNFFSGVGGPTSNLWFVNLNTDLKLNAGDKVIIVVYNASGITINLNPIQTNAKLDIHLVK